MAILLKNKAKEVPGLLFVTESMELMSAAGRRRMLEQTLLTNEADLIHEQDVVNAFREKISQESCSKDITHLRHQLMQLHDLHTTVNNVQNHIILDEVELFEIKNLAYITNNARRALQALDIDQWIALPDLQEVFDLLDPDHTGIPNFYIYDSYDPRLAPIRRQMKSADEEQMGQLLNEQNDIQAAVILRLCDSLYQHHDILATALEQMAYTDYSMARAYLAEEWALVMPDRQGDKYYLHELFNPRLREHNREKGLRYQPVDIELTAGVTLITGANMAGKTVLLKSVGVAQLMYQFGFPIPAVKGRLNIVDDVVFCIGDEQNEMNGLSSFASEITRISDVLRRSQNEHLLILIDEPARTTNPIEGKALVQSIATILQSRASSTMVTTHYSQLGIPCRRLRVRGFVGHMVDTALTAHNINRFIDYSLIPDDSDEVPQEALLIAEMLNCDPELIAHAQAFLK